MRERVRSSPEERRCWCGTEREVSLLQSPPADVVVAEVVVVVVGMGSYPARSVIVASMKTITTTSALLLARSCQEKLDGEADSPKDID